jgi:hypothetical protein
MECLHGTKYVLCGAVQVALGLPSGISPPPRQALPTHNWCDRHTPAL